MIRSVELEGGYVLHDDGSVFTKKGKKLKPFKNNRGYNLIKIYEKGIKPKAHYVHRLVGKYFVNNPENKPQINHKDGDKNNNHYSNLEWVTNQENRDHAVENRLIAFGSSISSSKLTEEDVIFIRKNYKPRDEEYGLKAFAQKYNITARNLSDVVNYKSWLYVNEPPAN